MPYGDGRFGERRDLDVEGHQRPKKTSGSDFVLYLLGVAKERNRKDFDGVESGNGFDIHIRRFQTLDYVLWWSSSLFYGEFSGLVDTLIDI